MERTLAASLCLLALAGCQAQNPFAMIGPATVPSPTAPSAAPYYPPSASSAAKTTPTASPTLPSVSATVAAPSETSPKTSISIDPSDREPIRIVENPAAARTATAPKNPLPAAPADSSKPATNAPGLLPLRSAAPIGTGVPLPVIVHTDSQVAPASYQTTTAASGAWKAR